MRGMLRAIVVAGVFASGAAFQRSRHRGPNKSNANVVQREHRRRYRSSWSPLFRDGSRTGASTISSNREYLSRTLGVSEDKLEKLSARTEGGNILTLEIGVLEERVHWLTKRLDLEANEMKKIAQQQPQLLGLEHYTPKLDYLQTRLLLDDASLRKMILTLPATFLYSIEDNIEPKLDWLQHRLHLDDIGISKMIKQNPALLGFSVDDNIEPKLDWLQQRLGLDATAVSKLVQRAPTLFNCNAESNLEPTLTFYINALGVEEEALALVMGCPALFNYSLEKRLKPRLADARDAGIVIDACCLPRLAKYTNEEWRTSLIFQAKRL